MLFIAASDEPEWLETVLQPSCPGDLLLSRDLLDEQGVGQDLALLSLCNHSVIHASLSISVLSKSFTDN